MKKMLGILFTVVFVCMFATSAKAEICSTFDADLDGWTSNSPSELSWSSSGGNPGGYVHFDDDSGDGTFIWAPSKFLGDWSHLNGVGCISYDHKLITVGGGTIHPYKVSIFGTDGSSAEWAGDTPTGPTDWVSLTVPLDESEWAVTGSWLDLLASVDALWIKIEMVENSGGDVSGIDNVCLKENCGGGCTAAAASTLDVSPVHGSSDLAYFLIPIGAVIGLSIWRRKR